MTKKVTVKLESLTEKVCSGSTPRGGDSVYISSGTALIRSQNVYNGNFSRAGLAFIPESIAEKMISVSVNDDDVLLNITGDSVARCCIVPSDVLPGRVNQHVMIIRADKDVLSPKFLMYYLTSPFMQKRMLSLAGAGGTRKALTKGMVQNFEIPRVEKPVQEKIAAILSAYDDLVENNRRRIELLEESARLLYQEWFVRLRFPGHETTRIINGIPEGWGEFCLEDFFSIKHGYAFRGEFFSETPTNRILLTPGNFKIGGGIKLDKLKFYSEEEEVKEEYILRINDLVLTMTDLSKESDTLGYPLLVPNFGENVFLHNQRLGKIIFKDDDFLRFLFFFIMQDPRYRAFVVGSASGTSVKHTSPGRILAYKTILPKDFSMEFLKHFNMIVKNNQFQIYNLFLQNQKLAEARDLLLPRLMSGEIEV